MCENLWLKQLPNHFIFRLLHYCHIALQLRDELAGKATPQRRHSYYQSQPFALWLTHLLLTYAADMLVNVLLGALPLEPLSNAPDVLLCSICWYLIFYSPYDMVHALARTLGFRLLAAPVNAINQLLVIDRGIYEAGRVYGQHAILPILVVGTILGSGAELLKPVAALLINRCQQSSAAFVKLST
ncbi:CG33061 [Drosophila busckii]|uniref:CG33061 n=2 Tax=Drosophila busckii TaxID=30019 RepID=A0A0M4EZ79_DROBS|nr:CG33061 [Drosophila busckii]